MMTSADELKEPARRGRRSQKHFDKGVRGWRSGKGRKFGGFRATRIKRFADRSLPCSPTLHAAVTFQASRVGRT